MPSRPWFKWFPGDYLADTLTLSDDADLTYRRLLDALWISGPLPDDESKLARICRLDRRKFSRCYRELIPLLSRSNGLIDHPKIAAQRTEALEKSREAAKSARARWDANACATGMPRARVPDPEKDPPKSPQGGDLARDSAQGAKRGTPRENGTNPRAQGANPRAQDSNPRAEGGNPRVQGTNPRANGKLRRMSDVALVSLCQSRKIPTRGKTRDELLASLEET